MLSNRLPIINYSLSTTVEAFRLTRRPPLKLKWIDTNKGDERLFNIRSRLVCTEIRRRGMEAIFSATPPLESLRALIAKAASEVPITGLAALSKAAEKTLTRLC